MPTTAIKYGTKRSYIIVGKEGKDGSKFKVERSVRDRQQERCHTR